MVFDVAGQNVQTIDFTSQFRSKGGLRRFTVLCHDLGRARRVRARHRRDTVFAQERPALTQKNRVTHRGFDIAQGRARNR